MSAAADALILSRRSLLAGLGAGAAIGALPSALWADTGGIEARFPAVTALCESYVGTGNRGRLANMVAALGFGAEAPGFIARGREGFDDPDPAGPDSLYRVYSLTKPVTGLAAVMLIVEGRLGLDQPIADFVPELARMQVATSPQTSLASRPAKAQITVRHLLTHTGGFAYGGLTQGAVGDELRRRGLVPQSVSRLPIPGYAGHVPTPDLETFVAQLAEVPLMSEPGAQWRYSHGMDVLGLVIARASGASSFEAFLKERIFEPTGMDSSFFQIPRGETGRLTTNYGTLAGFALPIDTPGNSVFFDPPPFAFGGSGLVSTPRDYDRFLSLYVNGGMAGRVRVAPEGAVEMAVSNLLPEGIDTSGTFVAGAGFGAGGRVGLGAEAGSFGWAGAAGTVGFVHLPMRLRAGLFTQYMPAESYPVHRQFPEAVMADLGVAADA